MLECVLSVYFPLKWSTSSRPNQSTQLWRVPLKHKRNERYEIKEIILGSAEPRLIKKDSKGTLRLREWGWSPYPPLRLSIISHWGLSSLPERQKMPFWIKHWCRDSNTTTSPNVHNYATCTASVRRNAICKVSSRLYLGYQIIRKARRHIQVWEMVCVIGVWSREIRHCSVCYLLYEAPEHGSSELESSQDKCAGMDHTVSKMFSIFLLFLTLTSMF